MDKSYYLKEVNKALAFIKKNIDKPISVKEVCEQSTFSRWEFQRIFRALVGDSIGGYLKGRRLSLAVKDLQKTDEEIMSIALKYQYSSQEAFSRSFKSHFNLTPGYVRNNKTLVLSLIKPEITEEKLKYISKNIAHSPNIIEITSKQLIGKKTIIDSTLGSENRAFESVLKNWTEFNLAKEKVSSILEGTSYGILSFPKGDVNQDKLEYTSCMEVRQYTTLPDNLVKLKLNRQKYAQFQVKGPPQSCHIIADYIYGIWLPNSHYQRAQGHDIEIFNQDTYNLNNEDSKVFYCIPIKEE